MRLIRLLADYGIEALYDETGDDYLEPTDLPLKPETQGAIADWQREYDETFESRDSQADRELQEQGERLASQMAQELGEEYKVRFVPS